MASPDAPNTGPKPFVLVLMPFAKEFNDVYTFGIKGAAEDVGAYAERIDEQIFQEGILDRIFNQINKADVIVADMTGHNENVFYEVGYAHALNKIVLLVTRSADDIPFDFKHRQHIIYSGEIGTLRLELAKRLTWAIEEAKRRGRGPTTCWFTVSYSEMDIPEMSLGHETPVLDLGTVHDPTLSFAIRNEGLDVSDAIEYIYLFMEDCRHLNYPSTSFPASKADVSKLGLSRQFKLGHFRLNSMPSGGVSLLQLSLETPASMIIPVTVGCSLRFHPNAGPLDFPFKLRFLHGRQAT
jgi:hypothetical protein